MLTEVGALRDQKKVLCLLFVRLAPVKAMHRPCKPRSPSCSPSRPSTAAALLMCVRSLFLKGLLVNLRSSVCQPTKRPSPTRSTPARNRRTWQSPATYSTGSPETQIQAARCGE